MIRVKHLMDSLGADDGQRIWVEPVGLTRDLAEWCHVQHILPHLGPPTVLVEWLEQHPEGYEYFRRRYHELLSASAYRPALLQIARNASRENYTLLHQGGDPEHNVATALQDFLCHLVADCPKG